ncbi:MAG: hypothetical protein JNL21_10540 [Myxococcales bacterium]|nr:hypothetical protein [Myxococcales bacterium]
MTNKLTLGSWLGLFVLLGCAEERRGWETEAGGVRARLDEAGLRLSTEAATIQLSLASVGRPAQELSLTSPRFATDPAGASLDRGAGVTEWVTSKGGTLEHGVTLDTPPPGGGPIAVTLRIEGARPVVDADGRGADFVVPSGAVRYGELAVIDAAGRRLPSRMSASGSELFVELDDAGATYPVVIDPTIWAAKEPLSGTETFGYSVAVANGMVIVGNPDADVFKGAVHVFALSGDAFVEVAKLTSPNEALDGFGFRLAASAGVLAVSSFDSTLGSSNADVFEHDGQAWSHVAQFASLGYIESMATDGTTVLVGALGQVAVLELQAGTWIVAQTLSGPELSQFGSSVAVRGDWAFIGAPADPDALGTAVGSVWVYHRVTGAWELSQVLTAAEPLEFGTFGTSVAVHGSRAIVGSVITSHGLNDGSAYVFDLVGDTWTETAQLFTPGPEASGNSFGAAVAVAEGHAFVGGPDSSSPLTLSGAVHVFSFEEDNLEDLQTVSGQSRAGRFGRAIAVENRFAAAGSKAGTVIPLVLVGQPCQGGGKCATGHCFDGHCCDKACDGQCEACDVPGNEGLCTTIDGAPHPGHPPCDGSCVDGVATPAGTCNGGRVCTVPGPVTCSPFACGQTECLTSCQSSAECAPGYGCDLATRSCLPDSTTCDGEHTLSRLDGTTESCAPYRCAAEGACLSRCTQTGDCVAGFVCNANGSCTDIDEQASGGCALDADGSTGASGLALGFGILAWTLVRCRRARRC